MSDVRRYLAEIGRRGGIKSRRSLDADSARRMVAIREARRAAKRDASRIARSAARFALPADTSAGAQAVQDALWRRMPPAEKLAQVARLSRVVDELSVAGLRHRHPGATEATIRSMRAKLRLGRELAARVYAAPRVDA